MLEHDEAPDLASSVYEQLRAAILNSEYRPGASLTEVDVAGAFGVSRTPVREALRRLEHDGILQRVGRKLRVRRTTPEEVLEIYDCRIVLEGMAGQWAAENRTDYDLAVLGRAALAMKELTEPTPAEMAQTNLTFHECLWRASHNATLYDLLQRLSVHTRRYPEPTISQEGRWDEAVREHMDVLDAIRAQDGSRAAHLASEHMRQARDLRLKMIMNSEEFQDVSRNRTDQG